MSILVLVAMTEIWLILLSGHRLMRKGPVTSRRPEANCFKNTTRFPLWTPATRINTVPGVMVERSLRVCWLKGFLLEAFLCLLVLDEGGLLVVHLGSREPHDPAVNLRISRRVNHFQQFLMDFVFNKTLKSLNKLKLLYYKLPH